MLGAGTPGPCSLWSDGTWPQIAEMEPSTGMRELTRGRPPRSGEVAHVGVLGGGCSGSWGPEVGTGSTPWRVSWLLQTAWTANACRGFCALPGFAPPTPAVSSPQPRPLPSGQGVLKQSPTPDSRRRPSLLSLSSEALLPPCWPPLHPSGPPAPPAPPPPALGTSSQGPPQLLPAWSPLIYSPQ